MPAPSETTSRRAGHPRRNRRPRAPAVVTARRAQVDYDATNATAMHVAQGYRLRAADALTSLAGQIEPRAQLKPDQAIIMVNYLRGLYAIPNEGNARAGVALPAAIEKAHDELKQARPALRAAKDAYDAKGLKLPKIDPAALVHSEALQKIAGLTDDLRSAQAGLRELPISRALNTKLGDVPTLLPDVGKALPEGLKFLRDIPVIDLADSGAIAEIQAQDDTDRGWSPTEAHVKDYASAGIGLAAGAAVVAVTLPEDAVIGAALLGGAVVVGVGDFAYQGFHEHWAEDIHEEGVVGGLLMGVGHVGSNTGKDLRDMDAGAKNAAESVWHGVFG